MRPWGVKRSQTRSCVVIISAASLVLIIMYITGFHGPGNSLVRDKTGTGKDVRLRNVENILQGQGTMKKQEYYELQWRHNELNNSESSNNKDQSKYLKSPYFNSSPNIGINDDQRGKMLESVQAYKVLQEFEGIQEVPLIDLAQVKIPKTVYYVWCPNKTLEFRQFLGILSIWKIMRPHAIEFHHQYPLISDNYNDWIDELKQIIPEFVTVQFPSVHDKDDEYRCSFWMGLAHVHDKGGIYIGRDIILTEEILEHMKNSFTVIYTERYKKIFPETAIIMGNAKDEKVVNFRKNYNKRTKTDHNLMCSKIDKKGLFTTSASCHVVDAVSIHPQDIWTLQTNFGQFARRLVYGSSDILKPKPFLPGNIPKIAHYVWFGRKEMTFVMYLSMVSTLFIANPEMVYIHGDGGLYGTYFEKISTDPRVVMIKHQQPHYIYGHHIVFMQHLSDILRADILLKYGGIYLDWDVVWLRDPEDIINAGYDAVANFDHMPKSDFPNTINLGVFMAKPRSVFVKRWQDAFRTYRSNDFLYNAVLLPYKIFEKYPQHLYIEKRLQVMCYDLKCHPVFHPDFKNFMKDQPFDWRSDVYSIHFTWPDPPEWNSKETCRNSTGRFAEIGKYVLQHEDQLG